MHRIQNVKTSLLYLIGFLKEIKPLYDRNEIVLFHGNGLLIYEKHNFNLGRLLLYGIFYPKIFKSIDVLDSKEWTFEVSDKCNLKCEGCHYYEDAAYMPRKETSVDDYKRYIEAVGDKIKTIHIGGAEPALEQDKIKVLTQKIQNIIIYSNGIIKIDESINSRIHISVWGLDDQKERGASVVEKAVDNYRNDPRAVFIITVTKNNLANLEPLVEKIVSNNIPVSFNHYSPTQQVIDTIKRRGSSKHIKFSSTKDNLILTKDNIRKSEQIIGNLIKEYTEHILYTSQINKWIHNPEGIIRYDRNGQAYCVTNKARHSNYKAITADLKYKPGKCCFSDMPCESCRLYAVAWPNFLTQYSHFLHSRKDVVEYNENLNVYSKLFRV